jgi:hypothetical protein
LQPCAQRKSFSKRRQVPRPPRASSAHRRAPSVVTPRAAPRNTAPRSSWPTVERPSAPGPARPSRPSSAASVGAPSRSPPPSAVPPSPAFGTASTTRLLAPSLRGLHCSSEAPQASTVAPSRPPARRAALSGLEHRRATSRSPRSPPSCPDPAGPLSRALGPRPRAPG